MISTFLNMYALELELLKVLWEVLVGNYIIEVDAVVLAKGHSFLDVVHLGLVDLTLKVFYSCHLCFVPKWGFVYHKSSIFLYRNN